MKKAIPYILILLMGIAIFAIRAFRKNNVSETKPGSRQTQPKDPAGSINRDRGFDRRVSLLKYSKHAKCRMDCRMISQAEVESIMQAGKINYNKSDLQNKRCPRYTLEGITNDNQRVRIVFAQCNESTTVVTVIDLERDFECNCPGSDSGWSPQVGRVFPISHLESPIPHPGSIQKKHWG